MNKIYFVGAGPGDVELISLKGHRLLTEADIVIYAGSLINHDLLNYCKKSCETYDSASLNLVEIVDKMEEGIKNNKKVVRLQTGDLSLYGSVREQIEMLNDRGIDYEIIPGISSFLGAAASLKVEYTVPELSQSLIITRIEGRTPVPELESIEKFAEHKTSMAIFLSVGKTKEVREKLLLGGYEKDTPVAIVYKATLEDEKIIRTNIENMVEDVRANNITKTALILVGKFLGKEYSYSKLYDKNFAHEFRKNEG